MPSYQAIKNYLQTQLQTQPHAKTNPDPLESASESLPLLCQLEWSSEFETFGQCPLRFTHCKPRPESKVPYDNIGSALGCLKLYQKTGNQEHLVDAANFCLAEFANPKHLEAVPPRDY